MKRVQTINIIWKSVNVSHMNYIYGYHWQNNLHTKPQPHIHQSVTVSLLNGSDMFASVFIYEGTAAVLNLWCTIFGFQYISEREH